MRAQLRVLHRWLGLLASLPLAVLGVTGLVLVWVRPESLLRLHVRLGMPQGVRLLSDAATIVGVVLVAGGLWLWWRRRQLHLTPGAPAWRRMFDLHHVIGGVGGLLMLLIAASGVGLMATHGIDQGMGLPPGSPGAPSSTAVLVRKLIHAAHTAGPLKLPLGIFWSLASLGFLAQGITGVLSWARRPSRSGDPDAS